MKRALAVVGVLLALAFAAAARAAEDIPTDEDGFTRYVAAQMRAAYPGETVTVIGPLEVKIGGGRALLGRIYNACRRAPDTCASVTENFVASQGEALLSQDATLTPAMIRAVVRPKSYLDEYSRLLGKDVRTTLAVRDVAGDLVVICYADFPRSMRIMTDDDFAALHLTKERALETGLANLAAELLPPRADNASYVENGIGVLEGSAYESSRMALHGSWRELARALDGKLLVAVPGADVVLFAKDGPGAVEFLAGAARHLAQSNERPISTNVFRWTETGWKVAAE